MSSRSKIEGSNSNSNEENNSPSPTTRTTSSVLTAEEASSKLEDHHCAICDNVLVNACRIGCGHTFCSHCLKLHNQRMNERGKPTCFICDAAVTEISRNSERDKEISKLYSFLSTTERLRRARFIAERKSEEEAFAAGAGRSRNDSSERTGTDLGLELGLESGDHGAFDEATLLHGIQNVSPPFYYGGQPGYVMWSGGERAVGDRYVESESEFNGNYNTEDNYGHPEEDLGASPIPTNGQFEEPFVIRHTIQHVFYTTMDGRTSVDPQNRLQSTQTPPFSSSDGGRNETQNMNYLPMRRRSNHSQFAPEVFPTSTHSQSLPGDGPTPFPYYSGGMAYSSGYYQGGGNYSHYGSPHVPAYPPQNYTQTTSSRQRDGLSYSVNARLGRPLSAQTTSNSSESSSNNNFHDSTCRNCNSRNEDEDDLNTSSSSCHSCECDRYETDRPSSCSSGSHFNDCESEECCCGGGGGVTTSHECLIEIIEGCLCDCDCSCTCNCNCDCEEQTEESDDDYHAVEEESITFNVTIPLPLPDRITIRTTELHHRSRPSTSSSGY